MNWQFFFVDIHNHKKMNENLNYCTINKNFEDEVQK